MNLRVCAGSSVIAVLALGCGSLLGLDDFQPGSGGGGSSSSSSGGGSCQPGETQPCYGGTLGTQGVGICHGGLQVCKADGSGFGDCAGEVRPRTEDCATPEDDDCDGVANQASAGCACAPKSTSACYDGPAGTEGVGLCVGGEKVCNDLGTAWGACMGEKTPAAEDCTTPDVDESCDGITTCTGQYRWGKLYGDIAAQSAGGIATDAAGNVVIVGTAAGAIDFGGEPLDGGADNDVVVAKLDPYGKRLWSKRFGDSGGQIGQAVAVDADGNVILVGDFTGTLNFGGMDLSVPAVPAGYRYVFVAKLDPDGKHLWSKAFGGAGQAGGHDVAVDAAGNVLLAGNYNAPLDFGGPQLPAFGMSDVFVAKLDPMGGHVWSMGYGDGAVQDGRRIAVDDQGDVVLCGNFAGNVSFGGPPTPPPPLASPGTSSAFVAKYHGGDGAFIWNAAIGASGATVDCSGLAIGPDGKIWMTGAHSTSPSGVHVTRYEPVMGMVDWSLQVPGTGTGAGRGIAVDRAGNAVLAASFTGTITLGTLPLTATVSNDTAVIKLDASGAFLWGNLISGPAVQAPAHVAVDPGGDVFVTGNTTGATDFGAGPITNAGPDLFVARFAP